MLFFCFTSILNLLCGLITSGIHSIVCINYLMNASKFVVRISCSMVLLSFTLYTDFSNVWIFPLWSYRYLKAGSIAQFISPQWVFSKYHRDPGSRWFFNACVWHQIRSCWKQSLPFEYTCFVNFHTPNAALDLLNRNRMTIPFNKCLRKNIRLEWVA
jgi:hypothetical protein